MTVEEPGHGDDAPLGDLDTPRPLYKRDFWSQENLKSSKPHLRLKKAALLIDDLSTKPNCSLLDIGCGSSTLAQMIRGDIQYFGIDIAIPRPTPNLLELDILEEPVQFNGRHFDVIVALGLFEYLGKFQDKTLAEMSALLNTDGTFITSYVNFDHRKRTIYYPYSNMQSMDSFRRSLSQFFRIERSFPTSYNWTHIEPNRKIIQSMNMHINLHIPVLGQVLGVEYLFICSPR
jgi:cyclopropane fatty-acyl-phospholipid synthase-like methyltransferase